MMPRQLGRSTTPAISGVIDLGTLVVNEKEKISQTLSLDCSNNIFFCSLFYSGRDIRTLWAGTHEHALTNYTARFHIWDHFDEFLHQTKEESSTVNPNAANDDGDAAPSF